RRDVLRDRLRVLAGDDVGRHRAAPEAAVLDRVQDALHVGLDLIEHRSDLAVGPGVRQGVAGAAVLLEEGLTLRELSCRTALLGARRLLAPGGLLAASGRSAATRRRPTGGR